MVKQMQRKSTNVTKTEKLENSVSRDVKVLTGNRRLRNHAVKFR